jgi:hypothetical protein
MQQSSLFESFVERIRGISTIHFSQVQQKEAFRCQAHEAERRLHPFDALKKRTHIIEAV